MQQGLRNLLTISRTEFIPANSASLIIGLSWGLTLPIGLLWGLGIPLLLAYATISLVAAFAAQNNSLADYELDCTDEGKIELVNAMENYNRTKLKIIMITELSISLVAITVLAIIQQKPLLLAFWVAAVFLAHSYSAKPLRLKSHSLFAVVTLLLVLSVLPVTFVAYIFTTKFTLPFWLFLLGQALTVYGVIVPAEIRDYFVDKKRGITTMTVQIGLANASLLGMILLGAGGILAATGLLLPLSSAAIPELSIFIIAMAAAYTFIITKYWKLYSLSRKHAQQTSEKDTLERDIVSIAAKNPKWITLITQVIVLMCLILLVTKLL